MKTRHIVFYDVILRSCDDKENYESQLHEYTLPDNGELVAIVFTYKPQDLATLNTNYCHITNNFVFCGKV